MKLIVAAVGKLKAGPERELYERYAKRITSAGRAAGLGPLETIETNESRRGNPGERCAEESALLLAKIPDTAMLVALDERGKPLSSEDIASLVSDKRDTGVPELVFAIGGPDGHGAELRKKVAQTLSLGAITLPHGLARVVLAEQLYRAVTILTGHPYHRS